MKKLNGVIKDDAGLDTIIRKDKVTLKIDQRGAYIAVKGYEDGSGGDEIIMLENYGGKLRLHIWADKNNSDPTHTIDLEKAKSE